MATYVIGDIQGCYEPFERLFHQLKFDFQQDELWLTGDLVNRGPDSLSVLRFARHFKGRLYCVLGNHDLHLLARAAGVIPEKSLDTLEAVLHAEDAEDLLTWLRNQPFLHYDVTKNTVMVHAGIYPAWSLQQARKYAQEVEVILQSKDFVKFLKKMYGDVPERWSSQLTGWSRYRFILNVFTRMRVLHKDGRLNLKFKETLSHVAEDCEPWFQQLRKKDQSISIVFGHWAALDGETHLPQIHALDTGCVWGRSLTALCLENGRRIQVHCCP